MIPIPGAVWRYGAAFALGVAIAATAQAWRYGEQIADIHSAHAQAISKAQAQARAEEQRQQRAIEGVRIDAKDKINQAAADASAAADHAASLQQQVDKLASRPARCPGASAGGEAADPARLLLADLFRRADERAGKLAAYADGARIAGESCQKSYGIIEPR